MSKEVFDPDHRIDLEKNTCPNREQRANGTNIYYGKASELIADAKAGNIKCYDRKLQQSSGCTLTFYLTVRVATIRDAAIIYHGPVGCSVASLGYREIFRSIPTELGRPEFELNWMTTNLQQEDVVYGASEKLKDTIIKAQNRYNPKAIFVLTTCTSGVIGEDIEGTVSEIQPQIKAKIVPVHCEGVRSRLVQTGYDAFWHGVLKYLVREPKEKQEDLINVASMLSYTWQDRLEIKRLLGKVGLRVNFVPEFASVEQFEQLGEAAVTAPLCPTYTDYVSRGLKQEYGVPYFLYPSPIGIKNTDRWLRKIGKYTGKEEEIEALIEEEHKIWVPRMNAVREELLNFKGNGEQLEVLGALGQGRLLSQIPFFDELGLKSSAALTQDFDNLILEDLEGMLEETGDFDVLVNTFQAAEQGHITRLRDPDITLTCPFQGGAYKREKSVTRLHALRGDPDMWSLQTAYAGAVAYGEFIVQSLKNKSFETTMKEKTTDSYKDWWYEQPDPLYYLDKETGK